MILAQFAVPLPMSPSTSHRRHPSAPPAVVVQPTKVPGILSIARSSRQQHSQSHPRQHRTPKPNLPASKAQPPSAEDTAKHAIQSKQPAADKKTSHPATPAADKSARGRQSKSPRDKAATRYLPPTFCRLAHQPLSSISNIHGRRNNVRQPSPPLTSSSQAEGTALISSQSFAHSKNPASNSFDPFLVSSDSDSENRRPPTMSLPSNDGSTKVPSLAALPSGKLARRRKPATQPPATPTPASRAVPVPRSNAHHHRHNLSRSAPTNSSALSHTHKRSLGNFSPEFPICDDTTDVEDTSLPSTPTRESAWHPLPFDGPHSAPLSASQEFPFSRAAGATPSPTSRHRRTPSEGVFNMSFDEDMSHSDTSDELKKLCGLPPKRFSSVGPSSTRVAKDKSGFFASSIFQNSPSPDELPPPAF